MRKDRVIILILLLFLPGLCWGQAKVGTAGVQFLKVGVSARAMGMAEAFVGVADDAGALYYNPGGLLQLTKPDHMFTHIIYPAGIQFEYLGTAWPVPRLQAAVGAQVTYLHTDDMDETTPLQPYGTGKSFNAHDLAFGLTYAQRLTNKFSVGGNIKYIEEGLADRKASGMAFDVGTFYNTGWKKIVIAMAIANFGPDMNFVDSPFPMPINFKFGASMRPIEKYPHGLIVAAEGWHPNDNLEQFTLGVEYGFMDMAFLRIGKKINGAKRYSWDEYQRNNSKDPFIEYPIINEDGGISTDGLTLGAGLKIKLPTLALKIDYAYANIDKLGTNHFFTLGLAQAQYEKPVPPPPPPPPPPMPAPPAPPPPPEITVPDTTGQAAREEAARLEAEARARREAEEAAKSLTKPISMEYGKAELTSASRAAADFDAELINKYPDWKVVIEGHCDERGSDEYNMALGERRAKVVKDHLVSQGVAADRLTTVSYGESRPADPGHNEEAWAKNRRVVLVVQ